MAYILAVNPMILADSGGPCSSLGVDPFSDEYFACKEEFKRQLVVATALTSMVACLIMGLWANLPIALSCGMGMNAYFTYNFVGFHGFGSVPWGTALTAVLIEGIVFFVLAITGLRYYIIKVLFPEPVRLAVPAAIGAFLAHLGLQTAEGIGLVVADTATAVTLGGCPEVRSSLQKKSISHVIVIVLLASYQTLLSLYRTNVHWLLIHLLKFLVGIKILINYFFY